jgi:endoribonuclease LACTB2
VVFSGRLDLAFRSPLPDLDLDHDHALALDGPTMNRPTPTTTPTADTQPPPHVQVFPVRTPTLLPATHTNSYALGDRFWGLDTPPAVSSDETRALGEREVLLVEPATPYADEQRAWLQWAEGLATSGRTLRGIFVTHHHPDHVGGAAELSRSLDLPVFAHPFTAARLDVPEARKRLLHDGDELVLAGPRPSKWEVLHTPGHAPGHLCLHDRAAGVLVVGDMVASVGTILIAPGDGDMIQYLEQLRRLEGLSAKVALPAHGDAIAEPSLLFARYVSHRLMRERVIVDAVGLAARADASGRTTTFDAILPIAYGDVPAAILPIAALSLRAHLDKLLVDGRLRTTGERWELVS